MSFIDNALEVLRQTEASLHSVIADALSAKAYEEIATIAAMAEAVAAINPGHARAKKPQRKSASRPSLAAPEAIGAEADQAPPAPATENPRTAEPSWMRPKT